MYKESHSIYHWVDGWDRNEKMQNFLDLMHLPELTGFPISGASCLDVGCGTGDLSLFLRKRGARQYLGVDIYEESLEKAQEKYPQEKFLNQDILAKPLKQTFDYGFCSGTFTIKLSANNYDFLEAMLESLWPITKVGIAFNILTDNDDDPDEDLFFYNAEKVMKMCKKVSRGHVKTVARDNLAQSHFYIYR